MTKSHISVDQLAAAFHHELSVDPRLAAETAYALALRYRNEDLDGRRRFDLAKAWAQQCISILESLPSESLDRTASTRISVGGVPIPEFLHDSIVRIRLGDILA